MFILHGLRSSRGVLTSATAAASLRSCNRQPAVTQKLWPCIKRKTIASHIRPSYTIFMFHGCMRIIGRTTHLDKHMRAWGLWPL
jgi:hypothetical protein